MTTPNSSSSQTKPQQQQQQRRQKFVLFRFVNFFFSKNNLVLGILSVFLGLLFIFYGLLKVSTVISSEMHRELRRSFVKFSKVLPWTRLFGLKVPSRYLRLSVGYSEIIGGLVLVVAPWERVKLAANLLLLAVSLNATICNCLVDEAFDRKFGEKRCYLKNCLTLIFLYFCRPNTGHRLHDDAHLSPGGPLPGAATQGKEGVQAKEDRG